MTAAQPVPGIPISLSQQLWAINDVLQQRIKGYPKLVSGGKLKQSEADYRIAAVRAAWETLAARDLLHRTGPVLAPAQIELFKAWQALSAEDRSSEEALDDLLHSVSGIEVVALARLLRDLAVLANRKDLVG